MDLSKTDRVRYGFTRLLNEASCSSNLRDFRYADFESGIHPFGMKLPKSEDTLYGNPLHVEFIGYPGTYEALPCMIRMIGSELTESRQAIVDEKSNRSVSFLRVISAPCPDFEPGKREDVYYEVCVRNRLFMTGGCTYYMGSGPDNDLECVISFLSQTYQIPVYRHKLEAGFYEKAQKGFWEMMNDSWQQNSDHFSKWRVKHSGFRNFQTGETVTGNPDVRSGEGPSWFRGKNWRNAKFEIKSVETLALRCTCGLGECGPVYIHPEGRCNLRIIHEAAHNQRVTVTANGYDEMVTGYYFDTNKLFS